MESHQTSIPIDDKIIWERRMEKLSALESVNGSPTGEEPNWPAYALLHTATKEGDIDKLIEALQNYSDVERVSLSNIICKRGPCGNSLLHVSAGSENPDILRALLKVIHDKELAFKGNGRGDTPLHIVARGGRIRMAELLLDWGINVDEANEEGNVALHEAVKNGHYELTDLLLRRGSKSVNKSNEEYKSPLYLAVKMGHSEILKRSLQVVDGEEVSILEDNMSPVSQDMLEEMPEQKKKLFDLSYDEGGLLHLAANENYVEGVKLLVDKFASSAFKYNRRGYLPIHVACAMGHLETIKELLRHWPDPEELLTSTEQQNILHVAAKEGKAMVVKYILTNPELEELINAKDKDGNTPLHVATKVWQCEVLLSLTRDKRVDLNPVNHDNYTPLDIVEENLREFDAPLRKRLTRTILSSAGTPRSKAMSKGRRLGQMGWRRREDSLQKMAETRMVVATLIAAVTFAAGFSVPGGYNSSKPDAGIATLLNKPMYDVFVICNSIAMYNSIIAVVILLWTHINDSHVVLRALRMARLPLLVALATMSVAFMAGVYVTINKRTWIAIVTLIIGITALFIISILYIALFIPLGYKCRLVQVFADYLIRAAILSSSSLTDGHFRGIWGGGIKG